MLQVNTAPAHHTVAFELGTPFNQRCQLGFLLRGQPSCCPRRFAVDHSLRPRGIEAVNLSAQPLGVHCADLGASGPLLALISRRNRQ